jgi:hypothetical protein
VAREGAVLPAAVLPAAGRLGAEPGDRCGENAKYPAAALAAQATATATAMIAPRPRVRRCGLLCNGLPLREPPRTSPPPPLPTVAVGFRA